MTDNAELHGKIPAFLASQFSKKEGRQCIGVDLDFSPGGGWKDESIRKWLRTDEAELFDAPLVHLEKFVADLISIAQGEADAKPAGRHCFKLRTHQHLGTREVCSFVLSPNYYGTDETALMGGAGGGRGDGAAAAGVIANHAGQLMRINAGMYDSTIRVLAGQNTGIMQQNAELHAENIRLRRENDELKSHKDSREFEYAMLAEKNARINAGVQKGLQIATVIASKIAASGEGGGNQLGVGGAPNPLAMLLDEFGKSLRKEQIDVLMGLLDMPQKLMFMEIMNMVKPPDSGPKPGMNGTASSP